MLITHDLSDKSSCPLKSRYVHSLSFICYFAPGRRFLTTCDERILPHHWEIEQKFCSSVKSPPIARTLIQRGLH